MGCVSTPFRRLPHQPKLFLRFVDDFPSVAAFYAHPPTLDAMKQVAQSLEFPAERRREVAAVLRDINRNLGGGEATQRTVLDAIETSYPVLRGTIRDHVTQRRRPFVRFFACERDLSHEAPDAPLPEEVASGTEPFLIVGAMAGG